MFHEVVRWMLQRDLLVTLHLRVRIVVPASLKARVRHRREELRESRWHTGVGDAFRTRRRRARTDSGGSEGDFGLFDGPPWYTRRAPSSQHNGSSVREVIEPPILEEGIELDEEIDDEEEESADEVEAASCRDEEEEEGEDDDDETSILADPGRATAAQRRWLQAMSEGKDELVTRRFDQFVTQHVYIKVIGTDEVVHRINQYFDGKCTDDEILFRAEISRRQLREVLHVYDEYVGVVFETVFCDY
jgi:nitrogen permease regulator 3-like protein